MSQMNQHGLSSGTPAAPVEAAPPAPVAAPVPSPAEIALQAELETAHKALEASKKTNRSIRITQALESAAAAEGVIDVSLTSTLLSRFIRVDDAGNFKVVSEENTPRLNSDFSPLSIQQFVKQFAEERPYLVASTLRGGANSSQAQRQTLNSNEKLEDFFGSKSNSRLASELARRDKSLYRAMRQRALAAGLIDV